MTNEGASTQFSDPRLVAIFDTANPIKSYKNFYLSLIANLSPKSIIDIGSGTGLLTCELTQKGYSMTGVEPSKALMNLARRRPGSEKVKWIEGYVEQLGDNKADFAIMTGHVAQFFLEEKDWRKALATIHKALNPNGFIAFESRNPLVPRFEGWPTEISHRKLNDPIAGDIQWWSEILEIKGNKVRYRLHYFFAKSGEEVISTDELIFRSRNEITQALSETGFSVKYVYGDWNSSAVTATSPELIFVAVRD